MADLTAEELAAVVREAMKVALDATTAERKRANERIYDVKQIAIELEVHTSTVWHWVRTKKFPLDKDPKGYSILRWQLDRWMDRNRTHVET